ncbi:MAG: hypothetical protein Q9167_008017 [Letrouitia subvulpina]
MKNRQKTLQKSSVTVEDAKPSQSIPDGHQTVQDWLEMLSTKRKSQQLISPSLGKSTLSVPSTSISPPSANGDGVTDTSDLPLSQTDPSVDPATSSHSLHPSLGIRLNEDPAWIRSRMRNHGIIFNDRDARKRNQNLVQKVEKILGWDRSSPTPSEASVEAYIYRQEVYKSANERTWLNQMMPLLMKPTFTATGVVEHDGSKPVPCTTERWDKHGLMVANEIDFCCSTLPNVYLDLDLDQNLAMALAKDDGMKNPRPDECYGLTVKRFAKSDDPARTVETASLLEIVPQMHHPFLFVEAKSSKGNLRDCENQALRGGTCLVNAKRLVLSRMGETDSIGADLRTFVFSITLGTECLRVWVHWAEVTAEGVKFHMTLVRTKDLEDDDALSAIRGYLHNILKWGLMDRVPELEEFHERLRTFEFKVWKAVQDEHRDKRRKHDKPKDQKPRKTLASISSSRGRGKGGRTRSHL